LVIVVYETGNNSALYLVAAAEVVCRTRRTRVTSLLRLNTQINCTSKSH